MEAVATITAAVNGAVKGDSEERSKKINTTGVAKGIYIPVIKTANGSSGHKIAVQ